ncbi:uncharacterized protein [Apostichopus japonicus]|uniref:uncharacterized protein n=1 Tax=Stichopus japonicus TaxID=307972 RepID=UPI003AB35AF7
MWTHHAIRNKLDDIKRIHIPYLYIYIYIHINIYIYIYAKKTHGVCVSVHVNMTIVVTMCVINCLLKLGVLASVVSGVQSCPDVLGCFCQSTTFFCNNTVNRLIRIPQQIPHDTTILDLNGHGIVNISTKDFSANENLRKINLSKNSLETVEDGSFSSLSHLNEIRMSTNNLTQINSGTFRGLISLRILDISNNRITFIDNDAFLDLHNLKTLRIDRNRLSFVSIELFRSLSQLSIVGAWGNPWTCDCSLWSFIHFLNSLDIKTRCWLPVELKKVLFSSLSRQNFTCAYDGDAYTSEDYHSIDLMSTTINMETVATTEMTSLVFEDETTMLIIKLAMLFTLLLSLLILLTFAVIRYRKRSRSRELLMGSLGILDSHAKVERGTCHNTSIYLTPTFVRKDISISNDEKLVRTDNKSSPTRQAEDVSILDQTGSSFLLTEDMYENMNVVKKCNKSSKLEEIKLFETTKVNGEGILEVKKQRPQLSSSNSGGSLSIPSNQTFLETDSTGIVVEEKFGNGDNWDEIYNLTPIYAQIETSKGEKETEIQPAKLSLDSSMDGRSLSKDSENCGIASDKALDQPLENPDRSTYENI